MIRRPPISTLFPSPTLFRSGITGIAWELGLLAGLQRNGVDLTTADLIVGTSAGAYVGALVATGVDLPTAVDRKSTRLNSSHANISYAVFCLTKKKSKRAMIA